MKILIPFVPHLAHECLEQLNIKDVGYWPEGNAKLSQAERIKIAVQINGKTKEIIEVKKDLDENNVIKESKKNKKINDQLANNEIRKVIFVKNKIINYLTN